MFQPRSLTGGLVNICIKGNIVDRYFKTKKPMGQLGGKKSNPNN